MPESWLIRFGTLCGVVAALSVAVPGAIEAFTGETTATSFVLGFGTAFGPPAVTAFYLHQAHRATRFDAVAYAVNLIGLCLFSAVGFALNIVVFYLDKPVIDDLLDGPTSVALRIVLAVFVLGTVLFGVSMLRARVFPRGAAWSYMITLPLLAILAPLPDSLVTKAGHVAVGASLLWLCAAIRTAPDTQAGVAGKQSLSHG